MKQPVPESPSSADHTRVVERPDGFYWQSDDTGREYGPFASLREAIQDMELSGEDGIEEGETLEEAEEELGISGWIDPSTGEPAEETFTRIEDL